VSIYMINRIAPLVCLMISWSATFGQNVGVGTAAPASKLHIFLTSSETQDIIRLTKDAANLVVVTDDGDFGIGTATPAAQLHTTGTVRLETVSGSGNGLVQTDADGDLTRLAYPNDANQVLKGDGTWGAAGGSGDVDWAQIGGVNPPTDINDWMYTMGNVGINFGNDVGENPYAGLHVQSQIYVGDDNGSGFFNSNPVIWLAKEDNPHLFLEDIVDNVGGMSVDGAGMKIAIEAGDVQIRTGITNNQPFNASGNVTFVIENNGFTGIGRDDPLGMLHIQGTQPVVRVYDPFLNNGQLSTIRLGRSDASNEAFGIEHKQDATASKTSFHYFGDNFGDALVVEKGGEIGIGTETPGYKLDVVGDIRTRTGNLRSGTGGTDALNLIANGSIFANLDEDANGTQFFGVLNGTNSQIFSVDESGNVIAANNIIFGGNLIGAANYDITGTSSIDLIIDSDNNSAIDEFKIRTDGSAGLDLITFQEDGDIIVNSFSGAGNRLIETDNTGQLNPKSYSGLASDVLTGDGNWTPGSSFGDNLGNHIATENIHTNGFWISHDGADTALFITPENMVAIGVDSSSSSLHILAPDTSGRNLRLWGQYAPADYGYGAGINFGDGNLVYIRERTDDSLVIYADQAISLMTTGGVGINTLGPTATFHVAGDFRLDDGNAQTGYVISSVDGDGNGAWTNPENIDDDWLVVGNDMTAVPTGNVGIGIDPPNDKLDVNGDIRINDSKLALRTGTLDTDYIQYTNNNSSDQ